MEFTIFPAGTMLGRTRSLQQQSDSNKHQAMRLLPEYNMLSS